MKAMATKFLSKNDIVGHSSRQYICLFSVLENFHVTKYSEFILKPDYVLFLDKLMDT